MGKTTTLIPIASGKGGVGKSLISANLAMALAEKGKSTIAVDLDFGGGNLHSLLGLPNDFPGIGDFLKAHLAPLDELLVPTHTNNLKFLPGDVRSPFMANIPHAQKEKLLNAIQKLKADYVVLDLGAGSSFNTLDFFGITHNGLLITTPQYTAIMNMLMFLKNFVFRLIERALPAKDQIRQVVKKIYEQPITAGHVTVRALFGKMAEVDAQVAERIQKMVQAYCPRIIFNIGYHPDELKIMDRIQSSIQKNLSLRMNPFGFIFEDPTVNRSIREEVPLLINYPQSPAAQDINQIADRIIRFWNTDIPNSGDLLKKNALQVYTSRTQTVK